MFGAHRTMGVPHIICLMVFGCLLCSVPLLHSSGILHVHYYCLLFYLVWFLTLTEVEEGELILSVSSIHGIFPIIIWWKMIVLYEECLHCCLIHTHFFFKPPSYRRFLPRLPSLYSVHRQSILLIVIIQDNKVLYESAHATFFLRLCE